MSEEESRIAAGGRFWDGDIPREHWLLAQDEPSGWPRSLLLEMCLRIVFPTVLITAVYLLFVGHERAGGGFSAGLMAGLAFVLRYVAGGSASVGRLRIAPQALIGCGLSLAVLTALIPVLFGLPVLSTASWTIVIPGLGGFEFASSLVFDTGVFVLVLGVVLNLLRTLGDGVRMGRLENELNDQGRGESRT